MAQHEQETNGQEYPSSDQTLQEAFQVGNLISENLLIPSLRATAFNFEEEIQRLRESGKEESLKSFLQTVNIHQDNLVLNDGHA